ncbi:MAG: glycosyltransferase family 4 protein [Acidimicrobiales bacterium]
MAQLGPFTGNVNVYSAANVEQRLLALGTDVGSPARRLFNAIESRKVGPEEERVWRGMDLVLAVSEVDAQAMGSAGATRVALCPNGADLVHPYPPPRLRPEEPLRLLFVGSGAYRPYERGLAWFVREVIPLLQGRCAARFDVVGQPPRRPVAAPGVTYHGRVPDVTPFYHQAHAVVVPVFEGSGTRLKVVEAVAHGRPVVSTPLGAEGLPLAAGEHYFQSDDPHDFAEALITIGAAYRRLEDPRLRHMLEAARAAIEPLFWPTIVKNLITLYRAQLEALEGRTTDPGPGR